MSEPQSPLADVLDQVFWEAGRGIVSAYLFGSMAGGHVHRDSDVDIGVLLHWSAYPSRADRFEMRLRLSSHIGSTLHRNDVDLVILNDSPPHLARRITTSGHRFFCADSEAEHAFRRTAMLRASDLDPFLRRARRVKLSARGR